VNFIEYLPCCYSGAEHAQFDVFGRQPASQQQIDGCGIKPLRLNSN
jgi:hypothetical protein